MTYALIFVRKRKNMESAPLLLQNRIVTVRLCPLFNVPREGRLAQSFD